jgi:hypothetical protein
MRPASACVVLVPHYDAIDVETQEALYLLAHKGHEIRRLAGMPVDTARNILASQALRDGFDELLWIDADIVFRPQDVERLRLHELPIVCGLYPRKNDKGFACEFRPGTGEVSFGKEGRLLEVRYCGMGFMLTRREVYGKIEQTESLVRCNKGRSTELVPYFQPMVASDGDEHQYLSEDYAFCERARRSGFAIVADTSVRLLHVGRQRFSWDDVARKAAK